MGRELVVGLSVSTAISTATDVSADKTDPKVGGGVTRGAG